MTRLLPALLMTAALSGCATTAPTSGSGSDTIPEEVLALAAPYQNLAEVEFRPEDGCFWYWHEGPVERTLLPLRTAQGNPICRVLASASG